MIILFLSMYLRLCLGLFFRIRARLSLQHPQAMSTKNDAQMHPDKSENSYYLIGMCNYLNVYSSILCQFVFWLIVLYIKCFIYIEILFHVLILNQYRPQKNQRQLQFLNIIQHICIWDFEFIFYTLGIYQTLLTKCYGQQLTYYTYNQIIYFSLGLYKLTKLNGQHHMNQQSHEQTKLQLAKSSPQQENHQAEPAPLQQQSPPRPCLWFILSWVIFIVAIVVYGGIWAITRFAVTIQNSPYYRVSYYVSPYVDVQSDITTCDYVIADTDTRSDVLYTSDQINTAQAVALGLVFSWLMWKLPMGMYMLHLIIQSRNNRIVKFVTWAVALVLMLAADILLTIFLPTIYRQFMFYAFATLLTIIVSLINNRPQYKRAFAAAFFPLFYIALLYFSYSYFIPALYNVFVTYLTTGYPYLMIYGYPVLDLIFYSGLLILNRKAPEITKPLLSFVQFFLIGYLCGITMLASVTEVEFYYLIAYMLFRNFFTNWVMWKWEKTVNNPPCLPGWGIVYYLSYIFFFLPLIGLGPLVVSKSFTSSQFSQSCLLLYYYPNTQYPYTTVPVSTSINITVAGYIFWPAGVIIWGISTLTQKYPRRKPTLFDFFYSMAGIYMFYLGISAGLQLLTLAQVVFKDYR